MPAKRRKNYKVARKNNPRVYGGGILGDVWKGIKKAAKFVKKHRGISRGAKIWQSLGLPGSRYAKKVGRFAGKHGYGKKRIGRKPGPKRKGRKPGPKRGRRRKGIGTSRAGGSLKRAGGSLKRAGMGRKLRAGTGTRQSGTSIRRAGGRKLRVGYGKKPRRRTKRVYP